MDNAQAAVRKGVSVGPLRVGPVRVDPPLLQAPMAGFTNYAYRQIVRTFGGVGMTATEMLSARSLLQIDARRQGVPQRLWGVRDEPRPLAVQIWDSDPGVLAAAGAWLVDRFQPSVIDLNFGCPVRNVAQRARSGSYLLRHPDQVGAIVARVVQACDPTPVTAKIRLGWTRDGAGALEVAQAVESAGAAAVTVHGRTAQEKFGGQADWDRIAEIKGHLRRIPLVGNGDLRAPESVVAAFRQYEVDGVMIGRGALAKPWLFGQAQAALAGRTVPPDPTLEEQRQLLLDHHRLIAGQFGEPQATILMRKYACLYAQGRRGARAFRWKVTRCVTADDFATVVARHFPRD
jgi:tRNA-dihydrouridine synthase B